MNIVIKYNTKQGFLETETIIKNVTEKENVVKDIRKGLETESITRRLSLLNLTQSATMRGRADSIDYHKLWNIVENPDNTNIEYNIEE